MEEFIEKLKEIRELDVHKQMAQLCDENTELYLIGGFIRDYLLGKDLSEIQDADYKVFGSDCMEFAIKTANYYNLPYTVAKSGDITFEIPNFKVMDFSHIDKNSTLDEFFADDDFTINTIGLRLNKDFKVISPFDGFDCVKNKMLKQLDTGIYKAKPYRLLRAFRFQVVQKLQLDESSKETLLKSFDLIQKDSVALVMGNLIKCFLAKGKTHKIIEEMMKQGFFKALVEKLFFEFKYDEIKNPHKLVQIIKEIEEQDVSLFSEYLKSLDEKLVGSCTYFSMLKLCTFLEFFIEQVNYKNIKLQLAELKSILSRFSLKPEVRGYVFDVLVAQSLINDISHFSEIDSFVMKLNIIKGRTIKDALFLNMCKELAKTEDKKIRKEIISKTKDLIEVLRS